jgi:FG-GAP-like repeat
MNNRPKTHASSLALIALLATACGGGSEPSAGPTAVAPSPDSPALLLAVAALGKNEDGSPKPLPARVGILTQSGDTWSYRFLEDPDSNVFHKALAYEPGTGEAGILTLGGTKAIVKLWSPDGSSRTLWEADFGGRFSRMRDAEVGDIYGDGSAAIAVATHDQGVVAVLRPGADGEFSVEELDRKENTVVHEIELGDLNGDGILEVYATPTAPNKVDGTPQPGEVVRYVPAQGGERSVVADLGTRHAKEILVDDVDGDGRDELYVSVEAVSGGRVEIRRYDAGTDPKQGAVVAELDDTLCRFLTAGDVDGDGQREMVAATHKKGLWLLRPAEGAWQTELIDSESSGFEHASILLDLNDDGKDELYVASDDQDQVRRYDLKDGGWKRTVLFEHTDGLGRFTWNITAAPARLLPAP